MVAIVAGSGKLNHAESNTALPSQGTSSSSGVHSVRSTKKFTVSVGNWRVMTMELARSSLYMRIIFGANNYACIIA
jgi:hypothetical protein